MNVGELEGGTVDKENFSASEALQWLIVSTWVGSPFACLRKLIQVHIIILIRPFMLETDLPFHNGQFALYN